MHVSEDGAGKCPVCGSDVIVDARCAQCGAPAHDAAAPELHETIDRPPASPPTGHDALLPGRVFGQRYHIIQKLGAGGAGAVYQAFDRTLGIPVALKILRQSDDPRGASDIERRLRQELLLARKITHKNVVRIHDIGEADGISYITMPYVKGGDLATLLARNGALPIPRALTFARQIVAGLCAAHEVGIVHRDLKPANILIDEDDHATIVDFGIAHSLRGTTGTKTAEGYIKGTLAYMAPEQAGGGPVDERTDVYSFGLVLYEMLAGLRAEPEGGSIQDVLDRTRRPPAAVRSLNDKVPESLDAIVSRCLHPDQAPRFQTAAALGAALETLDENGRGRHRPAATLNRRHVIAGLSAAAVVLAAAIVGWVMRGSGPPAPSPAVVQSSLLVANFVNATGDSVFDGTVEEALTIGLESASFLNAYNRREAARLAAVVKPGATLDEEAARLIALREGIDLVVAGAVAAEGSGYRLQVRAVKPDSGTVVADVTRPAASKQGVLDAIGELARDVQRALGGSAGANQDDASKGDATETFTAASLEAAHAYTEAQGHAVSGQDKEAVALYEKAIAQDPNFGRAYSGLGVSYLRLGRMDDSRAAWKKALSLTDRMTERERYRTLGNYYSLIARNYEQAIENNRALVQRYPGDSMGFNNLAVAYFNTLDFQQAFAAGRHAIELDPRRVRFRANEALYAMYATDFAGAARAANQAIELDTTYFKAYLPVATAALDAGDRRAVRDAFDRMARTGRGGASLAAAGLADAALYQDRPAEAIALLIPAIAEDERNQSTLGETSKQLALGDAHLAAGRRMEAAAAATKALSLSRRDIDLVGAARLLIASGRRQQAAGLAAELNERLPTHSRAYGRLVDGWLAMDAGNVREAVATLGDARKLADFWLTRFSLGVAYVQANAHAEALSEFETCQRRRGEAMAVFLDDVPTTRYLPPLAYWLARAQEGLGQRSSAATSYQRFLDLRAESSTDPLAGDARRRLETLR